MNQTTTSPPTLEKPQQPTYTSCKRKLILLIVSTAGLLAPMASAIYFPALLNIQHELNTTEILVDLTVSCFLILMAVAPLAWGSFSDLYGRRYIYLISMLIFVLSSIGCALSNSIELLILMRVFQGLGSSSSMVVGVGTISDIFPREERGSAIGLFLVGPLIGPIIGPVLGGYLNQYLGWRSIFWFLSIIGTVVLISILIFLPETKLNRAPIPIKFIKSPFCIKLNGPLPNPIRPLIYLKYLNVSLIVLYACFIFGSYYLVASTQAKNLTLVYNLNPSQIGLCYLPLGIGNLIGSIVGGKISDLILKLETNKLNGLSPRPEVRLYGVFVGSILIPTGLFLTGWSFEYKLNLSLTLIGQFFVGLGMTNVFSGTSTYLMDLFPFYVSSITACNLCLRTVAAAIVTSVNSVMLNKLGYGWTFSFFGFLQVPGFFILLFLIFSGNRVTK